MKTPIQIITIALIFSFSFVANAQVGIGTVTPADDAVLDINSSDKGLLIPRVDIPDLSSIAPITGGATEGLLVYNENLTTGPGFFFWNGAEWQNIAQPEVEGWHLTGNMGTNPSNHFLGTLDNQPIVFKTNDETRALVGQDDGNNFFNFISNPQLDGKTYTGSISGFSYSVDLGTDGNASDAVTANNVFGIDNQVYLRSGTSIGNQLRAYRNRIWAINSQSIPTIVGNNNDLKFEGSGTNRNTTNVRLYDTNLRMTAGAGVNEYKAFQHTFQSQIKLNDFYGFWFERADNINSSSLTRYFGYYQGYLGTSANRFYLYYNGDNDDTDPQSSDDNDMVVTGSGDMGLGTSTPNSKLHVNGSFTTAYTDTGSETGTFTIDDSHYTVRVFNDISTVALPDPVNLEGRMYILIGSNGISSKTITVGGSGIIYDDVSNSTISQLNASQRIIIQSDGTNWIVIGI